ncbi:MAG: hypothetical protein KDN20_14325 [Verrucomicrobiae bacterium]|nr:hypothetical protein [Verrucomicrobiae bacterium]
MIARPLKISDRFRIRPLTGALAFLLLMGGLEKSSTQELDRTLKAIPMDFQAIPEMTAIEAEIDAEIREKAEIPYEEAMSALADGYTKALTREMEVLRNSGQSDKAEALKLEIQEFVSGSRIPPTNDADVAPELQRLRTTFRREQARHRETRDRRLEPLAETYERKVEDLEFQLTKDGRVEEAKTIEKAKSLYWIRRSNLAVVSCEGAIAKFQNGVDAFSNRAYPWTNIPEFLPELSFIQNAGGSSVARKLKILEPGVIFMGADSKNLKDLEVMEKLGFLKLPGGFNYRDAAGSPMTLFVGIVDRPLEIPPADSFGGFVIIGDVRH